MKWNIEKNIEKDSRKIQRGKEVLRKNFKHMKHRSDILNLIEEEKHN